jgi:hypothetical protein
MGQEPNAAPFEQLAPVRHRNDSRRQVQMRGSGTASFIDPDDYAARIADASVNLVFTGQGEFEAQLTWIELPHLHLLYSRENLPRIASVSLVPALVLPF